ncbi:MAG TPA: mandelate racemase/muconate lactonizing enzyme family protein, partial [Thermomicrobiales bacterium]|nr:mandelate racemase/muconate lactonizing enzyme family protein [Thermomicrobiales bacterium]
MKITAIEGYPVKIGHRNQFVIRIDTDEGVCGVGEGGISGRELAMNGMLEHFRPALIGQDPRRIEHIWQMLYRGAYFEGGKITAAVLSAVDIALWDILGKWLGVPVWQLLGGACRDTIPCFATPGSLNGPAVIDKARAAVAEGWKALRFTPGLPDPNWTGGDGATYDPMDSINAAVEWLEALRRDLGSDTLLSIDFHHRLSPVEAALFCQRVQHLHLHFVEEPIRCENPDAYAQLRTMTSVPFAIGEEFSSKWAFAPYLERGLMNYARIDLCNVGGIREIRKIAGWCETHYVDLMPYNPLGPISTAAWVHLAAATSNFSWLEYFPAHDRDRPRDIFPATLETVNGSFPLPTAPGFGVEFNVDAIGDHAFEMWAPPRWFRP